MCSNDRAIFSILYSYRDIGLACYIMSKIAKFSHPRIIYRVDLLHRLTDPTKFDEHIG